jgi:hypothetical protein
MHITHTHFKCPAQIILKDHNVRKKCYLQIKWQDLLCESSEGISSKNNRQGVRSLLFWDVMQQRVVVSY